MYPFKVSSLARKTVKSNMAGFERQTRRLLLSSGGGQRAAQADALKMLLRSLPGPKFVLVSRFKTSGYAKTNQDL
jgi:hypothetical protein